MVTQAGCVITALPAALVTTGLLHTIQDAVVTYRDLHGWHRDWLVEGLLVSGVFCLSNMIEQSGGPLSSHNLAMSPSGIYKLAVLSQHLPLDQHP